MEKLSDIFHIRYGHQLDLDKQIVSDDLDGVNFVSRTSNNLGVKTRIKKHISLQPFESGSITVALGGSVMSAFVQLEPFYTAQNIKVLTPKGRMSFNQKLYYCICLRENAFLYSSHGREANKTLDEITVPSLEEIPSWVATIEEPQKHTKKALLSRKISLSDREWKRFPYEEIFEITGSRTTPLLRLKKIGKGKYPYVTTQETNNGVAGYYDFATEQGNVLTVDSAVAGYCAYQGRNFSASDHVEKLIPKFKMNMYSAMFLVTLINQEKYRYNYGRKRSQERLKKSFIKLPVTSGGVPDWQFMEDYIKSLPYSKNLAGHISL